MGFPVTDLTEQAMSSLLDTVEQDIINFLSGACLTVGDLAEHGYLVAKEKTYTWYYKSTPITRVDFGVGCNAPK